MEAERLRLLLEESVGDSKTYFAQGRMKLEVLSKVLDGFADLDLHDFSPEDGQVVDEGMKAWDALDQRDEKGAPIGGVEFKNLGLALGCAAAAAFAFKVSVAAAPATALGIALTAANKAAEIFAPRDVSGRRWLRQSRELV